MISVINEKNQRLLRQSRSVGNSGHTLSPAAKPGLVPMRPVMVSPETKCRNRRLEPSSRRARQNTFRNTLSESLNPFAD
jgi:hypothetical protein